MLVESAKVKFTRKKMGFLQFLKLLFQTLLICCSSPLSPTPFASHWVAMGGPARTQNWSLIINRKLIS
jgi:hypothetical protein